MNRRPWIDRYGTIAILVLVLFVVNPELQAFLLVTNFIGADLMIFFIVIQLRSSLPAVASFRYKMGTFVCVVGYTALRVTTRTVALLLAPPREAWGLTTLLFVLSRNMWCGRRKHGLTAI